MYTDAIEPCLNPLNVFFGQDDETHQSSLAEANLG
jgi:hypothetical protein